MRLGEKTISFAYSETLGETSYNYTRREVVLKGEGELEGVMLDASCYTETDCDAPNDAEGNDLWCLVSHTTLSGSDLRPLFVANDLCSSPVEVMEELAFRTASPSCFRVALASSLGAVGSSLETMAVADEMPDVLATRLFEMAENAGAGDTEPKEAMAILQEMRTLIAPYREKESGWTVQLAIEQAEAALEGRFRGILVGPTNVFYDVGPSTSEGWGPITPIAAPWDGSVN